MPNYINASNCTSFALLCFMLYSMLVIIIVIHSSFSSSYAIKSTIMSYSSTPWLVQNWLFLLFIYLSVISYIYIGVYIIQNCSILKSYELYPFCYMKYTILTFNNVFSKEMLSCVMGFRIFESLLTLPKITSYISCLLCFWKIVSKFRLPA